jgi:hypothetical protein
MELELTHGREDPDQKMDDWGFDGPVLANVHSIRQEYKLATTVRFATTEAAAHAQRITGWPAWDEAVLEVVYHEDMIVTNEPGQPPRYYGDLCLSNKDPYAEISAVTSHVRRAECALREAMHTLERKR